MAARHLYVHLPFCSSRCDYCDFVTVVGRNDEHDAYVDALRTELDLERRSLDARPETVYLGGGTPTFTRPASLERLLAALPACDELTVEANPETVTSGLASLLRRCGVDRVSLGAQSFQPHLLETLGRAARPDDVRRAFGLLREAGFTNISLDLIYGIPGQGARDLARDLDEALELAPEHISAYELEAKPGTRFTHAHGAELERQAERMESYFEAVVATLTTAGFRWYETANFCRSGAEDLRCRHNLGYWLGHDYLGLGVGAVSTLAAAGSGICRRSAATSAPCATDGGRRARSRCCRRTSASRSGSCSACGSTSRSRSPSSKECSTTTRSSAWPPAGSSVRERGTLALTERGRFLGGGVTARLLA